MAKLTTAKVRGNLGKGIYCDSWGLRLKVRQGGSRQWMWRGTLDGRRIDRGLGSPPDVTLEDARALAFEYRGLARQGIDPHASRMQAKAAQQGAKAARQGIPTFEEAAAEYLPRKEGEWKQPRQRADWLACLNTYVLPVIGSRPVDRIRTGDIQAVLDQPGLAGKVSVGRRALTQMRAVMQRCIQRGYRAADDNPAAAAEVATNGKTTAHHDYLPHGEVAAAMSAIAAGDEWAGRKLALQFVILTACRSQEVRGATWGEIDMAGAVWTIPAERSKNGHAHRVPLAAQALAILEQARGLAGHSDLVFPAVRGGVLNNSSLSELTRAHGLATTVHGFRSTFAAWAEEAGWRRELPDRALNHVVKGVQGAYFRSDLLDQRRPLMESWAAHCMPA